MKSFTIAIHGGAGTLVKGMMTPEKEVAYKKTLQEVLDIGYTLLEKGETTIDAVEASFLATLLHLSDQNILPNGNDLGVLF